MICDFNQFYICYCNLFSIGRCLYYQAILQIDAHAFKFTTFARQTFIIQTVVSHHQLNSLITL